MGRGSGALILDDVVRSGFEDTLRPLTEPLDKAHDLIFRILTSKFDLYGREALSKKIGVKRKQLDEYLDGAFPHTDIAYKIEGLLGLDAPLLTTVIYLSGLERDKTSVNGIQSERGATFRILLALRELQTRGEPWGKVAEMLDCYLYNLSAEDERDVELGKLLEIETKRVETGNPALPPSYVSAADSMRGLIRMAAKKKVITSAKDLAEKSGIPLAQARLLFEGTLKNPQLPSFTAVTAVNSLLEIGSANKVWLVIASETLPIAGREFDYKEHNLTRLSSPSARKEWNKQLSFLAAAGGTHSNESRQIMPFIKSYAPGGAKTNWEEPFRALVDWVHARHTEKTSQ
jgi:hypothetical protein